MTKRPQAERDGLVVEVNHSDVLDETIHELEQRGFEPVLVAFQNANGDVEVLTRKVDIVEFTSWLASTWAPTSRDLSRGREEGH